MRLNTRKKTFKKRTSGFAMRKKYCRFCMDKISGLDYKDSKRLESFIKERGKISSVRSSGNCAKHQRMVAEAIRKARILSLLP